MAHVTSWGSKPSGDLMSVSFDYCLTVNDSTLVPLGQTWFASAARVWTLCREQVREGERPDSESVHHEVKCSTLKRLVFSLWELEPIYLSIFLTLPPTPWWKVLNLCRGERGSGETRGEAGLKMGQVQTWGNKGVSEAGLQLEIMICGGSRVTGGGVRDEPEGFAVALPIPQWRRSAILSLLGTHWMDNLMLHSKVYSFRWYYKWNILWISLTDCSSVFVSLKTQMMFACSYYILKFCWTCSLVLTVVCMCVCVSFFEIVFSV